MTVPSTSSNPPILTYHARRPGGTAQFLRKNTMPFLAGAGISYGVKAAFAIAAAHIVVPAAAAAAVPIITAGLAGGVTKLLVNKFVYKRAFSWGTFAQGCMWGAVGGVAGQYLYNFTHAAHHAASAVPKPSVPSGAPATGIAHGAVSPVASTPALSNADIAKAMHDTKGDLAALRDIGIVGDDPALNHLVEKAITSKSPAMVAHAVKELEVQMNWGKGADEITRGMSKKLVQHTLAMAKAVSFKDVNIKMLARDALDMDKLWPKVAAMMPSPN